MVRFSLPFIFKIIPGSPVPKGGVDSPGYLRLIHSTTNAIGSVRVDKLREEDVLQSSAAPAKKASIDLLVPDPIHEDDFNGSVSLACQ